MKRSQLGRLPSLETSLQTARDTKSTLFIQLVWTEGIRDKKAGDGTFTFGKKGSVVKLADGVTPYTSPPGNTDGCLALSLPDKE